MIKRIYLIIIAFAVFGVGVLIGSTSYRAISGKVTENKVQEEQVVTPTEEPIQTVVPTDKKKVDTYNILLLGHGGAGHSGGFLMDSIILVTIDKVNKKVGLISIPRDLWVSGHKINEEYIKSPGVDGYNRAKYAVSSVTGLAVSNYISVDFLSFTKAVDALGGVEVNVEKTYDDYFYPIKGMENEVCGKDAAEIASLHSMYSGFELEKQFACRYEHIHFDPGLIKLDGETALKYVRSRHGDGDFGRSARQFTLLKGIVAKGLNLSTIKSMTKFISTDLETTDIERLFKDFGDPTSYQQISVNLTDQNTLSQSKTPGGSYILIPKAGINNYSGIQNYIINNLF